MQRTARRRFLVFLVVAGLAFGATLPALAAPPATPSPTFHFIDWIKDRLAFALGEVHAPTRSRSTADSTPSDPPSAGSLAPTSCTTTNAAPSGGGSDAFPDWDPNG